MDVGGGLGVDYDGTNSVNNACVNYTLQEYANDVIYTLAETCREASLPMPHIVSESGRALTAHHALLLLKVIDVESLAGPPLPDLVPDDHVLLHEMVEDFDTLGKKKLPKRKIVEIFHDASFDKDRAQQLFNSGVLSLRERAMAETTYFATINRIATVIADNREAYDEILKEVDATLVDRYFCNFSLFQSLPDSWAINQLFPIMPIHRLDREAGAARHAAGRDLRLRRQDRPLRRRARRTAEPRAARLPRRRGLHPRHLPHRRLPGDPRRPAQSVWRHQRGAHPPRPTAATNSPTSYTATP